MKSSLVGALRRTPRFLSRAWSTVGVLALLLGVLFLAWRIPGERAETREFWTRTQLSDGPHLFWLDDQRVRVITAAPDREGRRMEVSEEIYRTFPPDSLPTALRSLLGRVGSLLDNDPAELPWPSAPVAALSDIHGQYLHFRELLVRAGITDPSGGWTFGQGHLVILGDVFDKGPGVTDALWYIRGLEREARSQGGRVHYLLGNHELLALTGESKSFHYKYRLIADEAGLRYQDFFSRDSELGRWLRTRNSMLRIGDRLFVHGGLSGDFLKLDLTLAETNRLLRLSLDPDKLASVSLEERRLAEQLSGANGPLWWRGYFDSSFPIGFTRRLRGTLAETTAGREALDTALARYGVRQVVVGHTYTRAIRELYGGKLVTLCLNWGGSDLPGAPLPSGLVMFDRSGTGTILNYAH